MIEQIWRLRHEQVLLLKNPGGIRLIPVELVVQKLNAIAAATKP